ncbi:hypothetical protein TNCT_243351 [Trichonephila clavata]|uniref:Uncharacterized protein n=1 Tax=Trichonephila clavata TaxID=2740835 RepID=A0A8X6LN24_TRICU|nr:hypothetical protein TNCT_243351 [Trichonephila clavata]
MAPSMRLAFPLRASMRQFLRIVIPKAKRTKFVLSVKLLNNAPNSCLRRSSGTPAMQNLTSSLHKYLYFINWFSIKCANLSPPLDSPDTALVNNYRKSQMQFKIPDFVLQPNSQCRFLLTDFIHT